MGCDLIHTRCKKQRKKINAPATEKSSGVRKKTLTKKRLTGKKNVLRNHLAENGIGLLGGLAHGEPHQ